MKHAVSSLFSKTKAGVGRAQRCSTAIGQDAAVARPLAKPACVAALM